MTFIVTKNWTERFAIADQLREGKAQMHEPQDLPGRYGRVIKAIDRLLNAIGCEAVIAGGWAVWRHGYDGRLTQDVDIVLGADSIPDFLRAASVAGFEVLPTQPGRWPKIQHKETDVTVDILPEGEQPGTATKPAPTRLPHPKTIGGAGPLLRYVTFPALIGLKLAAGRMRDHNDVIELVRANPQSVPALRKYLEGLHESYVVDFDRLVQLARQDESH